MTSYSLSSSSGPLGAAGRGGDERSSISRARAPVANLRQEILQSPFELGGRLAPHLVGRIVPIYCQLLESHATRQARADRAGIESNSRSGGATSGGVAPRAGRVPDASAW